MSDFLWAYFYDADAGAFIDESLIVIDSDTSNTDNSWIITDNVAAVAKEHFGCDDLIGAPLESLVLFISNIYIKHEINDE